MAEGTRSKAESAKSIKIRELNELADQIGIRPDDRPTFVLAKFEEWENREREKEKIDREREKEKIDREREKEAHAFRMKEKEIELEKLKANDESRITIAADQNSPNCQTPHFNLEPFDETKESIETFLERFQNVATNNQLPMGKWSFRVSQALREQLRECMAPDLRIFIDESGVTTPQEIVSYSDRFLAAHREQKTKTSDQSPSIAKVDRQPDPSASGNNNNNKQTRQPNNQAPPPPHSSQPAEAAKEVVQLP
ncbi:hypothetical protein BgiBS90_024169 [Biomphalaria glabrata]|nr:hypothetical protein BgiBS90_024169 [Biomphalaria glabrata]